MDFTQAINNYLERQGHKALPLRAVLFDMDGVLFDSMPAHVKSWVRVLRAEGFDFTEEDGYMHEGQTHIDTINDVSMLQFGKPVSLEKIDEIYRQKTVFFNQFPPAIRMPGALELLQQIKACGLKTMVVTGSGTESLLERINSNYPNIFPPEYVISSFSVKRGKPHPDPYLKALEVANLQPNEAIVVENAPLGVQAAVAAGIFTVAVNTGVLTDDKLWEKGAGLVFPSMQSLCDNWKELYPSFSK